MFLLDAIISTAKPETDLNACILDQNTLEDLVGCRLFLRENISRLRKEFDKRAEQEFKRRIKELPLTKKSKRSGWRQLWKKQEYEVINSEDIEKLKEDIEEEAIEYVLKEHNLLQPLSNLKSDLYNLFPKDSYSSSKITDARASLNSNAEIFLRYLFPAPRSEVKFGFLEARRVNNNVAEKSTFGSSEKVEMFLSPPLLEDDQIEFYLGRMKLHLSEYVSAIKQISESSAIFKDRYQKDAPLDGYLMTELKIMKSSIKNIVEKPYNINTGLYTFQLLEVMKNVSSKVEKTLKVIKEDIGKLSYSDFHASDMYFKELGFRRKNTAFFKFEYRRPIESSK